MVGTGDGLGEGDGLGVGDGVGVGVAVGAGVDVGAGVGLGLGVGVGPLLAAALGAGVGVGVAGDVGVGVTLGIGSDVGAGVGENGAPGLADSTGITDGDGETTATVVADDNGDDASRVGSRLAVGNGPVFGRVRSTNTVAPTRTTSSAERAAVRICAERGFTSQRRGARARCDTARCSAPAPRPGAGERAPRRDGRAS
jgi:hypothetical protein